jgi:predicted dehydrogenase
VKPFEREEIRAVCDLWQDACLYAKEMLGDRLKTYEYYRKALQDPDVDAVMVMTPDHWHAQIAIDAAEAGKDVFIEKCPTRTIEEAVALKKTIERTSRILQLNEPVWQDPVHKKMRELVQSGALGKVHLVRTYSYRNAPTGAWLYTIPPNLKPDNFNWEEFQRPVPPASRREFDPVRVIRWRCWWDYGTGMSGDMFSHRIAAVNMVMGTSIPATAVASGGVYHFKDGREVPDLYHALNEYPQNDLTVTYSANLASTFSLDAEYIGSDATMTTSRGKILIWAETQSERYAAKFRDGTYQRGRPSEEIAVEPSAMPNQEAHLHEFFDCMRSRKSPSCNLQQAFAEDIACHLGTAAYRENRRKAWDSVRLCAV